MYSNASEEASGFTTSSSEPERKTTAWITANSNGSTPNSGGMSGKTATPSGVSSGSSATGHRGDDRQFIAVLDRRGEIIEIANVLIVEVDVDELAHLAVLENAL